MCTTFHFFTLISEDGNRNGRWAHRYVTKCVYIVCICVWGSQQACGELYSTLRYIGKPEKFPFQRGGNIEKRGQVSSEQKTDRMLLQSTPSLRLPVTAITPPGPRAHLTTVSITCSASGIMGTRWGKWSAFPHLQGHMCESVCCIIS